MFESERVPPGIKAEVVGRSSHQKARLVARFAVVGATLGLFVGVWEAALLYFFPRDPAMIRPDVDFVIWFLAPLLDFALLGLLGAALGLAVAIGKPRRRRSTLLTATCLGMVCAYLASIHTLLTVPRLRELLTEPYFTSFLTHLLVWLAVVSVAAFAALETGWGRMGPFFDAAAAWPLGPLKKLTWIALVIIVLGLTTYPLRSLFPTRPAGQVQPAPRRGPNVVLVVLDTVRADHVSAYGYTRPTTPNIDRLAAQGVLFEDAMTSSSWSLPSQFSMLTGLLPHQHGSNTRDARYTGIRTVAEILTSWGYETAGFSGNLYYGHRGWGLNRGFQVYRGNASTVRHNLARTVVGRTMVQPAYGHLINFGGILERRDAAEINRDVSRWFLRRSPQPFFLFINYFDVHIPYRAPPPFDSRFGELSDTALRLQDSTDREATRRPLPAEVNASLIAGYDNCLAFLDDQVGKLLQALSKSPEWSNTIVIVTSDHGEAFGEHGTYDHGYNLYREVLHVPLIIFGSGIPRGLRVTHAASLRELFPTVLDFARRGDVPFRNSSLRRFWSPSFSPAPEDDEVVSELLTQFWASTPSAPSAAISMTTSRWHYLQDSTGSAELYAWPRDPQEKVNLADSPAHQGVVEEMRRRLFERVGLSLKPWRRPEYLVALDRPGYSFLRDVAIDGPLFGSPTPGRRRVGATQAYFTNKSTLQPRRPSQAEQDLLRNLPYK